LNQAHATTPATVLQDLIRKEEQVVIASAPWSDRRLALLEICRACDMFFLTSDQHNDELVGLYREGCNKAIKLFLDNSCNLTRAALFPSSHETMRWANAVIQHCGRLSLCEKLLEYQRSNLGKLTLIGSTVHFDFSARYLGLESLERDEFEWVSDLTNKVQQPARELLDSVAPEIRECMRSLVRRWGNHFIAYDTTPEIDAFFQQHGILAAQKMFGQDSFAGDAQFGALPFDFYRALVGVLIGWGLKHMNFASLLVESNSELLIQNQITVTADIDKFVGYMADALGVTMNEAQQGLALVELGLENTECCVPGNTPPPLIRVSGRQYLKMPSGMLMGPFYFMLRNLRFRYRTDWDRAVNGREAIFRDELYALFPQQHLIKVARNVELKTNGKKATDIDAVVIDPANEVIGLFQLKWQDSFESSMKERSAKLRNFAREANEWISAVRSYVETATPGQTAQILNIPLQLVRNLSGYRLFVIGRNFAHFSGDSRPDPHVAWGLWPQVLRLVHQKYSFANPIAALHMELQADSPFLRTPPSAEEYEIQLTSHKVLLHAPAR
jgi:hypothetical protein